MSSGRSATVWPLARARFVHELANAGHGSRRDTRGRAREDRAYGRRAAATIPVEPDWIIPSVLARTWTIKVAAREKTGKGTLIANLLGCLERGEATVFGSATAPCSWVIYTEEPGDAIREKLDHGGFDRSLVIYGYELDVLARHADAGMAWEKKVDLLIKLANAGGHAGLFVDNVSRAAGVQDEAGVEMSRRVEYLSNKIKAAGLSCIIDHHHRKGQGQLGDKSRGGTGTAGAMDNNIELERIGDWESRVRRISSRGRISSTIWTRTIELSEDGRSYTMVADTDVPQVGEDRRRLEILADFGEVGAAVNEYAEAIGKSTDTARRALVKFTREGRARKAGEQPTRYVVVQGVADDVDI
jgi:hypothetical protein